MFNKNVERLVRRLGLPHFTPHQLRHSFCTNLCQVGVPIHVVAKLAGHSSTNITQRYVDAGEDPLDDFLAGCNRISAITGLGAGELLKVTSRGVVPKDGGVP